MPKTLSSFILKLKGTTTTCRKVLLGTSDRNSFQMNLSKTEDLGKNIGVAKGLEGKLSNQDHGGAAVL